MEKVHFDEAVKEITRQDARFKPDGYVFLRDALDFTITELRKDELIEHRHVSGPELLGGVVEFAIKEYGSMSAAVLDSWGIRADHDIGSMVFNLIETGAFGRSEEDSPSDFTGVLDLREELLDPYRPSRAVLDTRPDPEPPTRGNQPAKSSEI